MALTPQTRVTTADLLVSASLTAVGTRVTLADVLTAINFPSPFDRVSGLAGLVSVKHDLTLRTSNASVLVACRGRISNPKLRAWTFTLDGHDFYVLRLGEKGTLVFDVYSEQWMDWDAFGEIYWPVLCGMNWVGGQGARDAQGNLYGSNVLVGDDTYPLLYLLNPEQPFDENPESLDPVQTRYFTRTIQGQISISGRESTPCYAVWLTTDLGNPAYVGAGVQLEISDDSGNSYMDMGTVTVTPGESVPELAWYSLGQIEAPGRLFRITDDGAVTRIDTLEMNDPDDK